MTEQANQHNQPPEKPEEWECCESGCAPCVWDTYHEALDRWRKETGRQTTQ